MRVNSLIFICLFALGTTFVEAQYVETKVLCGASTMIGITGSGSQIMSLGNSNTRYKRPAYSEQKGPDKSFSLNFAPRVGFLKGDVIAYGLDLAVSYSKSEEIESFSWYNDWTKYSSFLYSAGPFIRIYKKKEIVSPFAELNIGFGKNTTKVEDSSPQKTEEEFRMKYYGGGLGMAFFIGEKSSLDLLAGYNYYMLKDVAEGHSDNRIYTGIIQLKLGISLYLD
ncbi:MAG: hypothetical protein U0T82_00785 [Bacteroidales bacterium]